MMLAGLVMVNSLKSLMMSQLITRLILLIFPVLLIFLCQLHLLG